MKAIFLKMCKLKKVKKIFILSLIFLSISLLFPAGSFYSNTTIESTSEYIANIAENHTTNGKYAAMMVEPNDATTMTVRDSYDEFLYLYGIFREGLATYAEAVNSEKSHCVSIKEIDNNINYSFFHIDRGYGAEPYKDHFKTITYPLEVMFNNHHPYDPKASFVYISQSVADKLLNLEGKEHTNDNYQQLIHSYITLEIDGKDIVYYIDNIYYETNYFYDALYEVMGDFIVGGAYYPPGVFKKQALFFLRNYSYQNEYYINYANSIYPSSDFNYTVLERNLKNNFTIDYKKINFSKNTQYDFLSVLMLVFCGLNLLACLFFIYLNSFCEKIVDHFLIAMFLLAPYLVFWFIHLATKNVLFFSSFSTISVLWYSLAFVVIYAVLSFIKHKKGKPNGFSN